MARSAESAKNLKAAGQEQLTRPNSWLWRGWVEYLEISQLAPDVFKLLGVTWIGYSALAPFEIDVELDPLRDDAFAKTTFRIGTLDENGRPQVFSHKLKITPYSLLASRPRQNRDWAMAVELTPPPREA